MTTILVVDDEYLVADVVSFALEDAGYLVVTASNGRLGLEAVIRERPDLVITDYMMPAMNGMELARALAERAGTGARPVPVVLMTGAQRVLAQQSPELFAAIIDKPFVMRELLRVVGELVGPP